MADKIMGYLQSENYALVFIFIALSAFINSFKLIDFYYSHKKRRVTELEVAIKSKHISPSLKKNLQEEIESEYFKVAHGVRASKYIIHSILTLHEKTKERVSFKHFVRTIRLSPALIDTQNTPYSIKPSFFEKSFCIYNLIFGALMLLGGLGLFFMQLTYITITFDLFAASISIFMICIGFVMLSQGIPLYSIWIINSELKNTHTPPTSQ